VAIRNHDWYNLNSLRSYPLDDRATRVSDDGLRLPNDILVDASLRFPRAYGRLAFVSSLAVTDFLVTVTFQAVEDIDSPPVFRPLAAVSALKSNLEGRAVALSPLADGVAGWLVFGSGIASVYRGLFTLPRQSLLLPRAARFYRSPQITSLRKEHLRSGLAGLVALEAGTDLTLEAAERVIEGETRTAVVFRLRAGETSRNVFDLYRGPCEGRPESQNCDSPCVEFLDAAQPDCDGNLEIEFRGDVHVGVPESGAGGLVLDHELGLTDLCVERDRLPDSSGALPLQSEDDCPVPYAPPSAEDLEASAPAPEPYSACGCDNLPASVVVSLGSQPALPVLDNLDMVLPLTHAAPATYSLTVSDGDCPFTISLHCQDDAWLLSLAGGLTGQGAAAGSCEPFELTGTLTVTAALCDHHSAGAAISFEISGEAAAVSDALPCSDLPYVETFDDGQADRFSEKSGTWEVSALDTSSEPYPGGGSSATPGGSSYLATDLSRRNVSVWEDCAFDSSTCLRVRADVRLEEVGTRHNAGLVLNYVDQVDYATYFYLEIDRDGDALRLRRWNGFVWHEYAETHGFGLSFDRWYNLVAEIALVDNGTQVRIRGLLLDPENEHAELAALSVTTHRYLPDTGRHGVGTDQAKAYFGYWKVEVLEDCP
jgi:hypothetical protein